MSRPVPSDPPEPTAASGLALLRHLEITRLRFVARAMDAIDLREFPGSALRGGLLVALFDVGCVAVHRQCEECAFLADCAVPRVLGRESPRTDRGNHGFFTRPYRITAAHAPPRIERGATFEFGIDLFGEAAEFAALLRTAVIRLGERGLGRRRSRFEVESGGDFEACAPRLMGDEIAARIRDLPTDRLLLCFDSPLRLQSKGHALTEFSFLSLMANLLRRASGLMESHGRAQVEALARPLLERASRVVVIAASWTKRDQVRFSSRQGRAMNLHGAQGQVEVAGDLAAFVPWLAFGEIAGAGKGTTFGHGSMRVLATNPPPAMGESSG